MSILLNEANKSDLIRYTGRVSLYSFLSALKYPGFCYLFIFRKIQKCSKYSPLKIVYRFMLWHFSYRFGFQIPYVTSIGKGFHIGHFGSIIINSKTKIGDNCNIAPGVVIGQSNRGKSKGTPIIGNKVWIGSGSVIVGNITIGDNVLIAPCSFVNISIPDNSMVIGNPATIQTRLNATDSYIDNEA